MFLPYNLVELCLISTCEIKHKSLPRGLIHGWEAGEGGDEHTLFLSPRAQAAQGHASPVSAPQPGAPVPSHEHEFCPGRLLEKEGPSLEAAREMLTV